MCRFGITVCEKKRSLSEQKGCFYVQRRDETKRKGGQKEENIHLKKRDRRMENDKKQKKMAQ